MYVISVSYKPLNANILAAVVLAQGVCGINFSHPFTEADILHGCSGSGSRWHWLSHPIERWQSRDDCAGSVCTWGWFPHVPSDIDIVAMVVLVQTVCEIDSSYCIGRWQSCHDCPGSACKRFGFLISQLTLTYSSRSSWLSLCAIPISLKRLDADILAASVLDQSVC